MSASRYVECLKNLERHIDSVRRNFGRMSSHELREKMAICESIQEMMGYIEAANLVNVSGYKESVERLEFSLIQLGLVAAKKRQMEDEEWRRIVMFSLRLLKHIHGGVDFDCIIPFSTEAAPLLDELIDF